jgi:hypothetical protein
MEKRREKESVIGEEYVGYSRSEGEGGEGYGV